MPFEQRSAGDEEEKPCGNQEDSILKCGKACGLQERVGRP